MKDRIENKLIKTIIEKYSDDEEIKEQIKEAEKGVKRGLYPPEEKIIRKYFKEQSNVLNIGCGAGREAFALYNLGYKVIAIDLHQRLVNIAREISSKNNYKINFLAMSATNLGFKDNQFDYCVMLAQLISCIPKRENRLTTLREAKRVLKPDGTLLLSTHSRNCKLKYRIYFFLTGIFRNIIKIIKGDYVLEPGDRFAKKASGAKSKGKAFIHMYSMKEAIKDIESAGFKILECKSRYEIEHSIDNPKIREKDYIIFYVAKKE